MTQTRALPNPEIQPKGFRTPLQVELGEDGLWVLTRELQWIGSDNDLLLVSLGEKTDFASVPRLAQALLPSADTRVVRAAVVHDFLCRELGDYYLAHMRWQYEAGEWDDELDTFRRVPDRPRPIEPKAPAFSAVDADAIFKKIMADEGAGWWMQNIGWLGVRLGAARNPARRAGWLSTLPGVAGLSTLFLGLALVALALITWLVPW